MSFFLKSALQHNKNKKKTLIFFVHVKTYHPDVPKRVIASVLEALSPNIGISRVDENCVAEKSEYIEDRGLGWRWLGTRSDYVARRRCYIDGMS